MSTNLISTHSSVSFKTSGKDVLASGTVQTFSNTDLEINIESLQVQFQFLTTDDKSQKIDTETISDKAIKLKLYNFENPLGTGLIEPIPLGTLRNREMFFVFTIYSLNAESIKTVHYTFFLGDAER